MEINSLITKLENAINYFEKELASIRTSRATTSMLDTISIDAYGSKTPLNQLGNISTPDSSTLTIQIWDTSMLKSVETAIIESNLGINPQSDGSLIRLSIPKLSEERRKELSKVSSQYSENAKVAIRNIRRDFIDQIKSGKPITVTDPDMTRFMMTLDHAVELVLYAFNNGKSGDIFVQKSPASTIGELAICLKGLYNSKVEIKNIGIRHAEKMHETLLSKEEFMGAEDLGKYYRVAADNRDLNYDKYYSKGSTKVFSCIE